MPVSLVQCQLPGQRVQKDREAASRLRVGQLLLLPCREGVSSLAYEGCRPCGPGQGAAWGERERDSSPGAMQRLRASAETVLHAHAIRAGSAAVTLQPEAVLVALRRYALHRRERATLLYRQACPAAPTSAGWGPQARGVFKPVRRLALSGTRELSSYTHLPCLRRPVGLSGPRSVCLVPKHHSFSGNICAPCGRTSPSSFCLPIWGSASQCQDAVYFASFLYNLL